MCKTVFGRIAVALCLVSIAGGGLSGCGSKNTDAAGSAGPASTGGAPSGNNQAAIDHGKAIAGAYAHRQQGGSPAPAPSNP